MTGLHIGSKVRFDPLRERAVWGSKDMAVIVTGTVVMIHKPHREVERHPDFSKGEI